MNTVIIVLLALNLILSSIIISYHFFKSQNKKEEKEIKEENFNKSSLEYKHKPHTVILCGVEYKSVKNASDTLGIPITTLDSWIKKYSPEVVDKKIQHYKPANNIVERTKYNIIIGGKEFSDHRDVAKKLGIAVSTLNRWYRDNIMYDKFNEYNIDYKKILSIEEVIEEPVIEEPKKKVGRPKGSKSKDKKQIKKSTFSDVKNKKIKISSSIPPKFLVKYDLKVNDEFDNFDDLKDYTGLGITAVYTWYQKHWIDIMK